MLTVTLSASAQLGDEWYQVKRMTMSGEEMFAEFGSAVAIDGDWIIIGARRDDAGATQQVGRVEFWHRESNWVRRSVNPPPNATSFDVHGEDVDIDGDWAVASTIGADIGAAQGTGAVMVYQRSATNWNFVQALSNPDGSVAFTAYGQQVAIDGELIAVGWQNAGGGKGELNVGRVDIFRMINPGSWQYIQSITPPGALEGWRVPGDLDLQDGTLVIGADRAPQNPNSAFGKVFVYDFNPGAGMFGEFQFVTDLISQGGGNSADFGIDVALDGDRIIVPSWDGIDVFTRGGGAWAPEQFIPLARSNSPRAGLSGDRFVITDPADNTNVLVYEIDMMTGLFALSPDGVDTPSQVWSLALQGDITVTGNVFENSSRGAGYVFEYVLSTETSIDSAVPNPSVVGQAVTFDMTVSADGPALSSGVIQLELLGGGGFVCTNVAVVAGSASCMTSFGSFGELSLVARYQPSLGVAAASESPIHVQMVSGAPTETMILDISPSPSIVGEEVMVSYNVQEPVMERGDPVEPTGDVEVSDGVDSCMGTVASGGCTLSLNTAGERTLTAEYLGDGTFSGSISPGVMTTVLGGADLALEMFQCAGKVAPGMAHRFLLRVSNEGPVQANGVSVMDTLPDGMTFLQSIPVCELTRGSQLVVCDLGNLVPDEVVEIVLYTQVDPAPPSEMVNVAEVSSLTPDPGPAPNFDSLTTLLESDLQAIANFEYCGDPL